MQETKRYLLGSEKAEVLRKRYPRKGNEVEAGLLGEGNVQRCYFG